MGDVLVVNSGSSSVKFALFSGDASAQLFSGAVTTSDATAPRSVVEHILSVHASLRRTDPLAGIVHRVVHGGGRFDRSQRITAELMAGLRALIPLAPNHLPDEIALIDASMAARPDTPHVACFDTAFHRELPAVSRTLPVPATPGLRRYGFHGLSYAFLMSALKDVAEAEANGRVVLAHLGNGASLAALIGGRCVDTTMGLTPTGGLVMSSRSGDLDPGVLTYIARSRQLSMDELDHLVTHESGLLGISGRSGDMQDLLTWEASDPRARVAVDVFCYQVRKGIGAFAAALGGLDTLVFSGGIGEHAPLVRSRVCRNLAFLGVQLDDARNTASAPVISTPGASVHVRVIPTNEALIMARDARAVLSANETTT